MGNLNHINSVAKANLVRESVDRIWNEGKSIQDYITDGRQDGRQEGRQEGENIGILKGRQEGRQESILNIHHKGFNAIQIADLLNFDLDFVQNVISKNNG